MRAGPACIERGGLCNREVSSLAFRDKNIGRFDVAMDDSFYVGSVERINNLDCQRKNRFEFHGTAGDPVLERRAVQKLHRNVGLPPLLPIS